MNQYKLLKHPTGNLEAVKQGWSWPGFFFSFIWAMIKKMWGIGIGALVGALVLGFLVGATGGGQGGDAIINVAAIITNVIFGINGNKWWTNSLKSRGYEEVDTVTAANPDGALALYLKSTKSTA